MVMTETTRARWGALAVAIGPVVLLAGLASHPFIARLPDAAAVAALAAADPTRWGLVHLTVAVGSGLTILAFLALRSYLRGAGDDRSSVWGLPFIVVGGTLFALLPGLEFAPMAAAEAGADVQAVQAALAPWFVPILAAAALTHALGILGFTLGIARSNVLAPGMTRLVVSALAVMALARAAPLGAVQTYVQGAAAVVALWPLAFAMWTHPRTRSAGQPHPMAA